MNVQRLYTPRHFATPTVNTLAILLDIAAALLVLGAALAFAYEMIALLIRLKAGLAGPPLITEIVRPWIAMHRQWAVAILGVYAGFSVWLVFHFYTG